MTTDRRLYMTGFSKTGRLLHRVKGTPHLKVDRVYTTYEEPHVSFCGRPLDDVSRRGPARIMFEHPCGHCWPKAQIAAGILFDAVTLGQETCGGLVATLEEAGQPEPDAGGDYCPTHPLILMEGGICSTCETVSDAARDAAEDAGGDGV